MNEIKNCPFCGGLPETFVDYDRVGGDEMILSAYVKCSKCGVYKRCVANMRGAPFVGFEELFSKTIDCWNERVV